MYNPVWRMIIDKDSKRRVIMLMILLAGEGTLLREAVGEKLYRLHNHASSYGRIGVRRVQCIGADGIVTYGPEIRLEARE